MPKILIADDDDNIRELVRITLEDEGFEIFEAKDGVDAVEKARKLKPNLMILDVMMPGKTGYMVCEEIKQNPATKNIFVLFLTARGSQIAEHTATDKGGDAYMTKPFEPAELRKKVRQALNMK